MTRLFAGTPFDVPPRCDRCGQLDSQCECPEPAPTRLAPEKQTAKVRMDRRKNKRVVTVVWGLEASDTDLPALLSKLQSACGSGGCVKDDQIELQGDHTSKVKDQLDRMGYKVR